MPELATLGPMISSLAKIAGPITGLLGAGSGLFNNYEQSKYQNMLRSYASNPTKLMNYAKGFTQPLPAGLLQGVENQAQGYAAERGLATSPALQQQIVSQAIAPYIQQQQDQGLNFAMQALGLGGGAQPGSGTGGLPASLEQLSKWGQPSGSTPPFLPPDPTSGTNPAVLQNLFAQSPINLPDQQPDLTAFAYGNGG